MIKILRDNLTEAITVGEVKCYSINEALREDLRRFKEKLTYGLGTYKGKILCLDIESECDPDDSKFEIMILKIARVYIQIHISK